MNRLEDNIGETKGNTGDTVDELKAALKMEKPTLTERITTNPLFGGAGGITKDLSTTCVLIWFFFAIFMFIIDFKGE